MKQLFIIILFSLALLNTKAQSLYSYADSIRKVYRIPELAYAVVSSDSVFELQTLGVQRINTNYAAKLNDRFHIGSNTKAITSFIAALLVQKGKLNWDTKFLSLFPELKASSKKAYYEITLQDLLSFRGKLPRYTYTYPQPTNKLIKGTNAEQRFLLAKYFLAQQPMKEENGLTPSNTDYILAGLMLERASGKAYKELVTDFGKILGIDFGFDNPNLTDTMQPWGHDANLKPIPPFDNYKLNWLLSAGNINVSLPDYIRYIQLQLKGLKGKTVLFPAQTFDQLLYGLPHFAFGWFNNIDSATNHHHAWNTGNAGAFITQVDIIKEADRAYIIFTNSYTPGTSAGIAVLQEELMRRYGK